MQLVQLQSAKERFEQQGIGLAAISYDSEAILRDFAQRKHIDFPLLADPNSQIMRNFGVLNSEAKGMTAGMALPGFVYIDRQGTIRETYFEKEYSDRVTAKNLISKLFPELIENESKPTTSSHLIFTAAQSDRVVVPGSKINLSVHITLPPDVHVYAPGVNGYKVIELNVADSSDYQASVTNYPKPQILFLDAIKERVPVFENEFKLARDLTVSADRAALKNLGRGKFLTVHGELKYQACDKTTCYLPAVAPVVWELEVIPLDGERSPDGIQHRSLKP